MKHAKSYYMNLPTFNGFKWSGYWNETDSQPKYHVFVSEAKVPTTLYWYIKATDEDIENGNLEFMALNNLTR